MNNSVPDAASSTIAGTTAQDHLDRLCLTVEDFPRPGISFRDLTPVFADGPAFRAVIDDLMGPFTGQFDVVAGIEARGFLLAAAVAYATGTGVVAVRKPGKLPRPVHSESYSLEYGEASLEIHRDDVVPGTRVLILDDVLATGGTLAAATALFDSCGAEVVGCAVVLELQALQGRQTVQQYRVHAVAAA
ncbi:adenine phosphoribosyltransferase [Arthrobacter sp. CAN_A1]|uniref:adenine phosphoribosyltransferase n=1 Tax=Arthrobacter sp. CAN_A1 TaxID=2787717 RepID=UPI001A23B22F